MPPNIRPTSMFPFGLPALFGRLTADSSSTTSRT
jgi:hypothetical protein